MVANSGLLDTGGRPLCISRDPAYPLRVHLQSGFRGANITREEELWNSKMSSVRQAVKWIFGDIVNFCKLLDFKKNFKIGLSPIGKIYIVSALLHNARSCFYGTIPQNILNVNNQLLKNILHIDRGLLFCYPTVVSNSSC